MYIVKTGQVHYLAILLLDICPNELKTLCEKEALPSALSHCLLEPVTGETAYGKGYMQRKTKSSVFMQWNINNSLKWRMLKICDKHNGHDFVFSKVERQIICYSS